MVCSNLVLVSVPRKSLHCFSNFCLSDVGNISGRLVLFEVGMGFQEQFELKCFTFHESNFVLSFSLDLTFPVLVMPSIWHPML